MTEEELRAIEARAEAATPGEWHVYWNGACGFIRSEASGYNVLHVHDGFLVSGARGVDKRRIEFDLEFCRAARADVPALIAEVRRLQGELTTFAKELNDAWSELYKARQETKNLRALDATTDEAQRKSNVRRVQPRPIAYQAEEER